MCEECHRIQCVRGCPNFDDTPRRVYECDHCGRDIYEGDTYYSVLGDPYCERCVIEREAEF